MRMIRHQRLTERYVIETSWGKKVVIEAADDFDAATKFHNYAGDLACHRGLKKTLVKETRHVICESTI